MSITSVASAGCQGRGALVYLEDLDNGTPWHPRKPRRYAGAEGGVPIMRRVTRSVGHSPLFMETGNG